MSVSKPKTIDTVVPDVLKLLEEGIPEIPQEVLDKFDDNFKETLTRQLTSRDKGGTLRMSNIGSPCERKLWYIVNESENVLREKLTGDTRIKFLYGDLTEEMIILLCELAGHRVEGLQDEVEISGIKGHRDLVLDGWVVDVKSASSYAFKKFKEGRLLEDDPFGYYTQLMSYLYTGQDDPLVTEKDRAAFLVFDKQLGHLCLDIHEKPDWFNEIPSAYERRKEIMAGKEVPDREFDPIAYGKSGNMKLPMFCSYCDFKHLCHPRIRTFIYSNGPRFLTTVKKEPDVYEKKE